MSGRGAFYRVTVGYAYRDEGRREPLRFVELRSPRTGRVIRLEGEQLFAVPDIVDTVDDILAGTGETEVQLALAPSDALRCMLAAGVAEGERALERLWRMLRREGGARASRWAMEERPRPHPPALVAEVESSSGGAVYRITRGVDTLGRESWVCTCPAFQFGTTRPCKHLHAVLAARKGVGRPKLLKE